MINPLTLQEAFDKIWNWFIIENKPFSHNKQDCCYRIDDNTKCAIGCLLPDKVYDPVMEGYGICHLIIGSNKQLIKLFSKINANYLAQLQRLHDRNAKSENKINFKMELLDFAQTNNLTIVQ